MRECDYPPCAEPAYRERGLIMEPEPVGVMLCHTHDAVVEEQHWADNPDFRRWFLAMAAPGQG